jgi:carbamoyltransferase
MKILGISGLNNSLSFKKEHFPNLEKRAYNFTQGFDSAAALIIDNQIIASAAEERFTRTKGTGSFPINAIQYCLQEANITLADLDYIAHGFDYEPYRSEFERDELSKKQFQEVYSREAQLSCFKTLLDFDLDAKKFISLKHHYAHAASTFFVSGFNNALILVADGMGENQSLSIAVGEGEQIKIIKQIPEIHSLGILYSVFTYYLGLNHILMNIK